MIEQLMLPLRWYPLNNALHYKHHPLNLNKSVHYIGHNRVGNPFVMHNKIYYGCL
jgi:hypothetical protein